MVIEFYVTNVANIDKLPRDIKPNWTMPIYTTYESIANDTPATIEDNKLISEYVPYFNPQNSIYWAILSNLSDENDNRKPYLDRSWNTLPEDYTGNWYAYPLKKVGDKYYYDKNKRVYMQFNIQKRSVSNWSKTQHRVKMEFSSPNLTIQTRNSYTGSWSTVSGTAYPVPSILWYDRQQAIDTMELTIYTGSNTMYEPLCTSAGEYLRALSGTFLKTLEDNVVFYLDGLNSATHWFFGYPWLKYPTTSELNHLPRTEDINQIVTQPLLQAFTMNPQTVIPSPVVRFEPENAGWNAWIRTMFNSHYIIEENPPQPKPEDDDHDEDYDDVVPTRKDYSSDKITHTLPTFDLSKALINVYSLTPAQMSTFAEDMWNLDTWEAIQQKIANSKPMDYIIGLKVYPSNIYTVGSASHISLGAWQSPNTVNRISTRFVRKDMGGVSIPYFYGDYNDMNTKISIYLPFISMHELNVQDVIGANLHLYYDIDVLTGECVATITVTRNVDGVELDEAPLYHFNGMIGCDIPITSGTYSNFAMATIGTIMNTVGSVASKIPNPIAKGVGKAMDVGGSLISGFSDMAGNSGTQRAGSLGGNSGLLAPMTPYLIIERPVEQKPEQFFNLVGQTSRQNKKLSACKGYTIVENIDVVIPNATKSEIDEIRAGLLSGVYIK